MPPPDPAAELRRAARWLVGWALAALALAAVYANPYAFGDAVGVSVPDVGISAMELTRGFVALTVSMMGWAGALVWLGSPGGGVSAMQAWRRAVALETRYRWAWLAAVGAAGLYAWSHVSLPTPSVSTLDALTAGDAVVPYQYRALVPWVVAGLSRLTGGAVSLELLYGALDALAAIGVWLGVRRFLRPHVGAAGAEGDAARSVAALGAFVPLALGTAAPWRYNALFFPADTASVAAFAFGLALLQERRWLAYYLLFAVATVNRETTCFLTIAWVLASWGRVPLRRIIGHAGAQLAIWVTIKGGLATLYAGNPALPNADGGLFVLTVERSVLLALALPAWVYLGLALGGSWLVVVLLSRHIRGTEAGRWLRVVPVFLLAMALVGEVLEVRIYAEMIPLVTAGLWLGLRGIARSEPRPVLEAGQPDTSSALRAQ